MKTLVLNRNVIVSIFAVLMLTYSIQGISYGQEAPDTIVEFSDANLAREIREALRLPAGDGVDLLKIPKAELAKLTKLTADDRNISDLTGLEHASQLTVLNLEDNNISNLTPLAQLTQLTSLNLEDNKISDLTPLTQLTQLTELDLSGEYGDNNISDLTPLTQLTQLKVLDLSYNNISDIDITPLAQLTQLTELNLRGINISDLTPLAHLRHLGSISAGLFTSGSTNRFHGSASEIPLIKVTSSQLLVETTLNGSSVTLTLLRDGTAYDVSTDNIRNALTVSGIKGVSVSDITRVSDTEIIAVLEFTGNFDIPTTLTFTLEAEAVSGFDARALTGTIGVHPEGGPTITASTPQPLTGATLDRVSVTLTLSIGNFNYYHYRIGNVFTIFWYS